MQKPIMIIGEAWGEQEERTGQAFAGPSGQVLFSLLREVGIAKEDCYFTNVFNLRPRGNRIENLCGPKSEGIPGRRLLFQSKYIRKEYEPELIRLQEELDRVQPNIVVALGNTPMWALANKTGIKKHRGSPMLSADGEYKLIPSWHPSSILRQWELRPIVLSDFSKVKREAAYRDLRRPVRYIYTEPTLEEFEEFYHEYLKPCPYLSCDIETKLDTITEVGYGTPDGKRAIVLPFWDRSASDGNYWRSFHDERKAWNWVRRINANHKLMGQNFMYDLQYFWRVVRIPCPYFEGDTMLLHHALQPEMEKGLGFLGSIYTDEPSWKFMRTDHSTLKRGDD